jgi:uncharacterized protein
MDKLTVQSMDAEEIISKTEDYARRTMQGESSGHDWWHAYRVWKTSIFIGKEERADLFVVQLGALLHDIGDYKLHSGDQAVGPQLAGEWLEGIGVGAKTIYHVEKIIEATYHDINTGQSSIHDIITSKEAAVVWDADKLDALGAIGILRAAAYGGYIKRAIWEHDGSPRLFSSFEEYTNNNSSTINHFYEKLLLLKNLMQTETGKKIARDRHAFMLEFLGRFYDEWEGKL